MRILILSPAIYDWKGKLIKQNRVWLPGLTLPYIAALFPKDNTIRILDETAEEIPFNQKWDLVCITAIGASFIRAIEISKEFQNKSVQVLGGGIAPSLMDFQNKNGEFTSFINGEFENIFDQVYNDFLSNNLKSYYTGTQAELSNPVIPRYDLFNRNRIGYWMPVQSSRGCKYSCPFCSVTSFHKGIYRKFPIEHVIECIRTIKKMGCSNITLIDDSIGSDIDHLRELCIQLIPLKINWMSQCTLNIAEHPEILDLMAKSGCTMLSIGIETINNNSLTTINKNFNKIPKYKEYFGIIRSYGIDISTEMMIGLDGDTETIFNEFYSFAVDNYISLPRFYIVTPIPGTPFYEKLKNEGRIFDFDYKNYSGARLVFRPKLLENIDIEYHYWKLYKKVYSIKNILRRYILSRPKRGLLSNVFTFGANFHYRNHIKRKIPPGIV